MPDMEIQEEGPYRTLAILQDTTLSERLSDEDCRAVAKSLLTYRYVEENDIFRNHSNLKSKIKELRYEEVHRGLYVRYKKFLPSFLEEEVAASNCFISFTQKDITEKNRLLVILGSYDGNIEDLEHNLELVKSIHYKSNRENNLKTGVFCSSTIVGLVSLIFTIALGPLMLLPVPLCSVINYYLWRKEGIPSAKLVSLGKDLPTNAKDYIFSWDSISKIEAEYNHVALEKKRLLHYEIFKDEGYSLSKQEFLELGDYIRSKEYKKLKEIATKNSKKLEELIRYFEFSQELANKQK